MLAIDVFFEIHPLLLDGLSVNVTDVAIVFFIVLQLISQISKTGKGIEHDSRNDITEKNAKEDTIDGVINKSNSLE